MLDDLFVENEYVRVNVSEKEGLVQIIFSVKSSYKDWTKVIKSACPNDISNLSFLCYKTGVEKFHIRYSKSKKQDDRTIVLIGEDENIKIETKINLLHSNYFYIENKLLLKQLSEFDYIYSNLLAAFNKESEYDLKWVPHVRLREDNVIADFIFRSPLVYLQKGNISVGLIPNVELIEGHEGLRNCINYEQRPQQNNWTLIAYGIQNYKPQDHVRFQGIKTVLEGKKNRRAKFGYFLYLKGDSDSVNGLREPVSFLWRRFAAKYLESPLPQVMPFEKYARYGAEYFLRKNEMWREFELNGMPCGGSYRSGWKNNVVTYVEVDNERFAKMDELNKKIDEGFMMNKVLPDIGVELLDTLDRNSEDAVHDELRAEIWNQTWFCNFRSAYGLYYFGKKWGDKELVNRATKMKNLALNLPENQGFFSVICFPSKEGINWVNGSKGFHYTDSYSVPDMCWTAYWMLKWYNNLEKDEKLLEKAKKLGEALKKQQLPSGAIPTWIRIENGKYVPDEDLKESTGTSAAVLFLAELYKLTKDKSLIDVMKKGMDFIIRKVIPRNLWLDYETFFSCTILPPNTYDQFTAQYPNNNMCIFWTAEALKEVYRITGEKKYLDYGRRVLDILLLFQQVWNPPYISFYAFGGFGCQNTDAEWSDIRQALFAPTLLDYYKLLGEKEYLERGIYALKASFTLMLVPKNGKVAPTNIRRLHPSDYGAIYENYGHTGYDRRVHGYITFDWGTGTALTTLAYIQQEYSEHVPDIKE
ncbi:MAG: hypothetical protein ACUVXA_08155 [Candidatus Jordarchaeum sp.]|uniref:hypothetical protein n=1 Tax=Candidatus Jordarchaeum sp. TaxID=2823881 RepID=UPI00404A3825